MARRGEALGLFSDYSVRTAACNTLLETDQLMKTLYFDVDGTLLVLDRQKPKPCLVHGQLEAAIRHAGFEKLICVGNFSRIARLIKELRPEYDDLGVLLGMCGDAFSDERWFRSVTSLTLDPERRTDCIDLSGDWWYVDDQAARYFRASNRDDVFAVHQGGRVFVPDPTGDGQDVLDWLAGRR